ncbi:helix-turn-helix XRE-family transcriptional regulators [Candidatus Termititenax aidoneus]|uniref:Helix-turn-helix XRE-family transcriptional regulators n=1 Tax=Termititenax aidoneus TaxID=2218524 RepID=A0A388TBU3_TERA1|nr:helix-turn-helix XRE-family transcriptional regulators [Candidatus Termititenax aidoneus]
MTNEILKKLISGKLEFLRKNSGETNEAAADSLDIDLSEFYRILKGHRLPHLKTLLRINRKYGVSMDWWFSELDGAARDKTPVRQKAFELQIAGLVKKLDAKTQEAVLAMLKILVK